MVNCEVIDGGPALEVKVEGDADVANARALQEELTAVFAPGRDVVLHLDGLERLDGAGLQLLFAFKAIVEQGGATFRVEAKAEVPLRALETAGATSMLGLD